MPSRVPLGGQVSVAIGRALTPDEHPVLTVGTLAFSRSSSSPASGDVCNPFLRETDKISCAESEMLLTQSQRQPDSQFSSLSNFGARRARGVMLPAMGATVSASDEDRHLALRAIEVAKSFIQSTVVRDPKPSAEQLEELRAELTRSQRTCFALVLAFVTDEYCPAALFRPWASVRRIRDWRDAGKLDVIVRHGRCCVRPSEFFRHWRSLPDETRRP